MITGGAEERWRLESVLGELYRAATLIPLDEAVARKAHQQARRGLGPQDALIYVSVLLHLRDAEARLLRNPRQRLHRRRH